MTAYPVLTVTTFLPLVGAIAIFLMPERLAKWIALATCVVTFLVSMPLYTQFDKTSSAMQFVETAEWIPSWSIGYGMGVDGISVPFIFLSALMTILCVTVSWTAVQTRVRDYYAALLVSLTAMVGLFACLNFFLFYLFWELMIVPIFLLIGVWGGPTRTYAAVKFLMFTLAGSVLMLVGLISLLYFSGTLDFQALAAARPPYTVQFWLFIAFFAAFAVKVPMFPVHTWLPDAHTEAPTAGSVILAGILLKMGAYGFLRISLPILPDATQAFVLPMQILSGVAIVYGAYVTLTQTDIKRLIAYSSVSHMGFVTLGIFTLNQNGVEGAVLQMVNHGIVTGGLFLLIGMIYERTHTRELAAYGGLAKAAPIYTIFLVLFCLAAAGTPGLNSFIGEFLIISGGFREHAWLGAMGVWGVGLGTTYILWLLYRVALGDVTPGLKEHHHGLDLNAREVATLVPLVILVVLIGVYPESFLGYMRASVTHLLGSMQSAIMVRGL